MPANLQKARDHFLHAVGKLPSEQWESYVAEACGGDGELEQQVNQMLRVHRGAGSFLESPAAAEAGTIDVPLIAERLGTTIGPYKLLQQIGEGGMGTVYMAEQTQPIQRKVALKIIKAGMDSKQVIARFEAERQALAMMDHVNIARVFDGGATENGRPYFVMELVHGIPITKYCDDNHLTPRQRLELFVPVCQAIQHAHQKGIIHRDIKPSNVMITLYDGKPVPKVIDFGVAKATEQKLTERTLFTQYGTMVGTLEYMSPEQAEMSALGVDTRSDIYSLGVLLYELLTGSTPLTHKRMKEAAYAEILRMIKEEEPPRPSTRLSDSGEALASISANRHTEPAKLTKLVKGELDWIVMKALEKDRARRYETANGFAADVQRYLADEPVQACPASAAYQFRKFVRRHRRAVLTGSAAAAVVVLAVAGLVVGTLLFQREQTRAANDRAELEAEANRQLEAQLYRQRIALAEREWYANNLSRMEDLLEQCPPDQRGWEWRYLKGLRSSTRAPLSHPSAPFCVAFSLDGKLLATGTQTGVVRIWQARTGTVLREWKAHGDEARTLSFSPDGRQLASGGFDGMIKLWDVETILQSKPDEDPKPSFPPLEPTRRVWSVAFSTDGKYLASGSGATADRKGELKVWDLRSGQEVLTLSHFTDTVTCVAFSPDGQQIVSTCQGLVQLWDAKTGQEGMPFLRGPDTRRVGVAFSPDGRFLASVGGQLSVHPDEEVQIWDVHTGQLIRSLPGHVGGLRCVTFSPDGRRIASAGLDQTIKIWDARTGDEVLTLRGHIDFISSLAFSADGHQLASASADRTVRIWDATPVPEQGSEYRTLLGHTGPVTDVAFHPTDECTLVSAGTDGTVRTWDVRSGKHGTMTLTPSNERVKAVYSPDGRHLAAVGLNARDSLGVWEVDTRKQVGEIRHPRAGGICLAFTHDGRYVATAGHARFVHVSDAMTGEEVPSQFKPHDASVFSLAFSPDGQYLATGSADRTVRIWDWKTSKELPLTSLEHAGRVTSVTFSRDSKRLASASLDRTVKVWDTTKWELLHDLPQSSGVQCVAFDRDGPRLAWGSNDGTVTVWDGPGTEPQILRGHTSWIQAVAFSPNGKWIASASLDGTIKIWDAPPVPPAPDQEAREPVNSANPTPAEED